MRVLTRSYIAIVALGTCLVTPAAAQSWSDDMESYANGSANRDPAGGGGNANFSNGLEIVHTP